MHTRAAVDLEVLAGLERWVQAVPALPAGTVRQPDLTLWFDLAPEVAAGRLVGARAPDKSVVRLGSTELLVDYNTTQRRHVEIWPNAGFGKLVGNSVPMRVAR